MLYALNLYSNVCQLFFQKNWKKYNSGIWSEKCIISGFCHCVNIIYWHLLPPTIKIKT